ncbi:MAG: gliding motility-associated C-terminal domain-containing protein, partial [Bacteroidota bacterium]|nr:gliding motility-associated C-terminal domain-containing protein [Bacteroidota bacterium]
NHATMLLQKSFVKCTAAISLEWSAYQNMNNGLQRYEIWYRENGGPWTLDGFVPATVLFYEKVLTTQSATYEFIIRAIGGDGQTASSNKIIQLADIFNQPAFLYIRSLNVSGSSVSVNCFADTTGDVVSYRLYRSTTSSGPFSFVTEIPFNAVTNFSFFDAGASANEQQHFYKFTATDSCGLEQVISNIAGTVFLIAEGGNDFTSELNWINYFGWQGATGKFNIYQAGISGILPTPIATISGDTLFFTDDVSDFPVQDGNICYAVQAVEETVNSFGLLDSSLSNIACAPQSPGVYIPNAFTPKGKNPVFKPYLLFGDPSSYSLEVYNRWGQRVFASDKPEIGWQGNYENADAPAGIYAYMLVFKGFNRKEIRRSGTVMLLR